MKRIHLATLSVAVCALPLANATLAGAPRLEPVHALERVAIVGASVSAGFNLGTDLGTVLDVSLAIDHAEPENHSGELVFLSPGRALRDQLKKARESEPTLLLAADLAFWAGYGTKGIDGKTIHSPETRVASLNALLTELEAFEMPIVLGDFPDMSDAVGKMISRSQMPSAEGLEKLNGRLRAWADERDHVHVLPLGRIVGEMRAKKGFTLGTLEFEPDAKLLQPDELHPTEFGLEALMAAIALRLVDAGLATAEDFELELDPFAPNAD